MNDSTLHLLQGLAFFAVIALLVFATRSMWGPRLKAYYGKRPPMLYYWSQGVGKLVFAVKSDKLHTSGQRVFRLIGWSYDSPNSRFGLTLGSRWTYTEHEADPSFRLALGVATFDRTGRSSDHFVRELDSKIFRTHLGTQRMRKKSVEFTALVFGGNPNDLGDCMTVTLVLDTGQEQGTIMADLSFDLAHSRLELCERSPANRYAFVRALGALD